MKVDGPGNIRGKAPVRKSGKTDGASGAAFSQSLRAEETAASTAAPAVSGASGVSGISGILAAQEVDDAAERESRGKRRAIDMLEKLEEIQHGLLSGDLRADKLIDLTRLVQSRKVAVDDPRLAQVLDEIDLRAQVELAKFQR